METIIKEHGQTILGIIFSILVMGLTAFTVLQLNKSMPVFNTDISNNNARFIEEMKTHSPSIEVDDLIYVDYESEFEIYNYVKVNDYNGKSLIDRLQVSGDVNTNTKGLYTLWLSVTNDMGYGAKAIMNIIVE